MGRRANVAMAFFLTAGLAWIQSASAAMFEVTRADDPEPGGCLPDDCSLREALLAAAATPGGDRIELGPYVHVITRSSLSVNGPVELVGAGRDVTWVVADGDEPLFEASIASSLHLRALTMSGPEAGTIRYRTFASVRLDQVVVPWGSGSIAGIDANTNASVQVIDSELEGWLECSLFAGQCEIQRSRLSMLSVGGTTALEMADVEVGHADPVPQPAGVIVFGRGPVMIRDSLFRSTGIVTLYFDRDGDSQPAPPAVIRRTRFLGNYIPLMGDRNGEIHFVDCEFSDNRSHDAVDVPAVLLAGPGPTWRFTRSTLARNLGGGDRGGAIRVESGGRVWIENSTLSDNGFRPGDSGLGWAVAVVGSGSEPAPWLRIDHSTLANFQPVPIGIIGKLLHIESAQTAVGLYNSVLRGNCSFAAGGQVLEARGNLEASGDTCGLAPLHNLTAVPIATLALAPLADNGGFAPSHLPGAGSAALAAAHPGSCLPDDQRGWLRPSASACDIGSIQRNGIDDRLFVDGFEL